MPVPSVIITRSVLAAAGAEAPFGPGGGVGVVVDHDRDGSRAVRRSRRGSSRQDRWGANSTRERSASTQPAAPMPTACTSCRSDRSSTSSTMVSSTTLGLLDLSGVSVLTFSRIVAVGVHDPGHDLGAADVDADGGDAGCGQVRAALARADGPQHAGAGPGPARIDPFTSLEAVHAQLWSSLVVWSPAPPILPGDHGTSSPAAVLGRLFGGLLPQPPAGGPPPHPRFSSAGGAGNSPSGGTSRAEAGELADEHPGATA